MVNINKEPERQVERPGLMRKRRWWVARKVVNDCYGKGAGETIRDLWIYDHPVWTGWAKLYTAAIFFGGFVTGWLAGGHLTNGLYGAFIVSVLWAVTRWAVVLKRDEPVMSLYEIQYPGWHQSIGGEGETCNVIPEVARLRCVELSKTGLQGNGQAQPFTLSENTLQGAAKLHHGYLWKTFPGQRKQPVNVDAEDNYDPQYSYLVATVKTMWETHPQDFLCEAWLAWPDALELCLTDMGGQQVGQVALSLAQDLSLKDARFNRVTLGELIETAQMVVA